MKGTLLCTGGSGTFGSKLAEMCATNETLRPDKLIMFSRGWQKQDELRRRLGNPPWMRWFIGDVRDLPRLKRAFPGVDCVIHAAALKSVPDAEYNPREALLTNTLGSQNVVDAAIDCSVKKVMLVSTDKACLPFTLYGKTKAAAESLFTQANHYSSQTRFACVRYGNVLASAGSVIPLWREQAKTGTITLTSPNMTRFWLTADQAVRFTLDCLWIMYGGEIFVPKLASCKMEDLAEAVAPNCKHEVIGLRTAEKLYETLVSADESEHTLECPECYVILPQFKEWAGEIKYVGEPMQRRDEFSSDSNVRWLSVEDLRAILDSET